MSGERYEIHIVGWDKFQHGSTRDNPWIKNYLSQLHKYEYMDLSFHLRGVLHGLRLLYAASGRQLIGTTATLSRQLGDRVMTRDLIRLNDAGFITLNASVALAQNRVEVRTTSLPNETPSVFRAPDEIEPVNGHAGAQRLVAHFVDRSRDLGSDPPRRLIGQVAKLVKELTDEGQSEPRITAGIDLMLDRRLHPATLPSCVQEAALPAPSRNGHKPTGWRLVRGSHGSTLIRDPSGTDRPPQGAA